MSKRKTQEKKKNKWVREKHKIVRGLSEIEEQGKRKIRKKRYGEIWTVIFPALAINIPKKHILIGTKPYQKPVKNHRKKNHITKTWLFFYRKYIKNRY